MSFTRHIKGEGARSWGAVLAFLCPFVCLLLCAKGQSSALDVHAVYRGACQRYIGVILRVEKRRIHLLQRDGTIKEIPRHEIVSLVYYPVAYFPFAKAPRSKKVKPIRIHARHQRHLVELAFGWPINYSKKKLSVLMPSGKDFTVDKGSIWSISAGEVLSAPAQNRGGGPQEYYFEHPQTSGFCAQVAGVTKRKGRPVFPQQILNDSVVIRRELDRLMTGYDELLDDIADQKFYPVPQIYKNRTSLGFWASGFSRYGSSESRSNNFTPLLTNTFSAGPFRYQHIFYTGSTPNGLLLHNEAQTQIFYRFKAAYFHTSLLIDPSLALVGKKYFWRAEDLAHETVDDRLSEWAIVELGFDFGPLAVQLQPVSVGQGAVKLKKVFHSVEALLLWRWGVLLTFADWSVEAMGGYSFTDADYENEKRSDDGNISSYETGRSKWQYIYGRLNLTWNTPWQGLCLRLWTAVRNLTYHLEKREILINSSREAHNYDSLSVSTALRVSYPFWHRFEVGANLVLEVQRRKYSNDTDVTEAGAQTRALPKFALFGSMSF